MNRFDWSKFGSEKTQLAYRDMYDKREIMRSVDLRDFHRALIAGPERTPFDEAWNLYIACLWEDREMFYGKILRHPDRPGQDGRELTHLITGEYAGAYPGLRTIEIMRFDAQHCISIQGSVIPFCQGMSCADLPGLNRDDTIELSKEEFDAEMDKALSEIKAWDQR